MKRFWSKTETETTIISWYEFCKAIICCDSVCMGVFQWVLSTIYSHSSVNESLLHFSVGSGCCEGTPRSHSDIRVGVLSLWATILVQAVFGLMSKELRVHVPAEFLRSCLRIVKLHLGLALEWIEFFLKLLELLFSTCFRNGSLRRMNLGGFLRDSNHWT